MNGLSDSDHEICLRAFSCCFTRCSWLVIYGIMNALTFTRDLNGVLEFVFEREVCIVDAHARGNFAL